MTGHLVALSAEAADGYLTDLCGALRSARLNQSFPEVAPLLSHLEAMTTDFHGGTYATLEIDRRSGLPSYREWSRVLADQALAPEVVRAGVSDKLPAEAKHRRQRKNDYHRRLLGTCLLGLDAIDVQLRRKDVSETEWRVRFDKLDGAGCLQRYTLEFSQRANVPISGEPPSERDVSRLQSVLYPLVEAEAEWSIVSLGELPGVRVQRVEKGCIGPIFHPAFVPISRHPVAGLARDAQAPTRQRCIVASFGTDAAGAEIQHDGDDDPFSQLVSVKLSPGSRELYQRARGKWNYGVYKGRKFVVNSALVAPATELLQKGGTRNLVYPLRTT